MDSGTVAVGQPGAAAHRAAGLLQLAGGHHGLKLFTAQVPKEGGLKSTADDKRAPSPMSVQEFPELQAGATVGVHKLRLGGQMWTNGLLNPAHRAK